MSDPTDADSGFRWDDLKLFLVAYRTGSLTQAAAKLGLNQSTLSRRLGAFEEQLGARLFDRTPEGLRPTELAERLLEPAERVEAATFDVARWSARADSGAEGEVKVALSEGIAFYVAAPAVPRLLAAHPRIRISFVVSTESADLTRREADLAIRFYRPTRGDLVAKKIWAGPYAVYGSPALAERLGPGPLPLAGLPFIGWDTAQAHIPEARWEAEREVEHVARATSMTTRIALAQGGVGAIELARSWGSEMSGLVELPTEPIEMGAEVWLVSHRALREVPRVRAVWDWIEAEVSAL